MVQKKDGGDAKHDPPLEKRKVTVNAWPASSKRKKDDAAVDYAKKVDKHLKKEIEEAMDGADPGVEAQVAAAQEAVDEAQEVIDPNLVARVDVEVTGEVDSQPREFDLTFVPGDDDEEEDG